jgi:hypothetical protein
MQAHWAYYGVIDVGGYEIVITELYWEQGFTVALGPYKIVQ